MPTSAVVRFSNARLIPGGDPTDARTMSVKLAPSTTYTHGMFLGELTATPGMYAPYVAGNSDGSQFPKVIMEWDAITDASSNITFGAQVPGEWGQTDESCPVYFRGLFDTADLVQSGAGAIDSGCYEYNGAATGLVPQIPGRLIQGTSASGLYRLG